jgi:hypothetical protein
MQERAILANIKWSEAIPAVVVANLDRNCDRGLLLRRGVTEYQAFLSVVHPTEEREITSKRILKVLSIPWMILLQERRS